MLRLIRVSGEVKTYGYVGTDTVFYQCLMDGRREIDREEIPFDVIVDMRCFGSTQWKSKFAVTHPELF